MVDTLRSAVSLAREAESGQRGYILTGKPSYLAPYTQSVPALEERLQRLQRFAQRRADWRELVERFSQHIHNKLDELSQTIRLYESEGPRSSLAIVQTDRGKASIEAAQRVYGEAETREERRSAAALKRAELHQYVAGIVATVGSAALLVLLTGAFWALRGAVRAQTALFSQTERARALLQKTLLSIGDAVVATDQNGNISLLNPVAERLTGWTEDEARGRPLEEVFRIVNETTREPAESPVRRVLRLNATAGLEGQTILLRRDGTELSIEDSGAPIRDQDGSIRGVVLVFRDISDRRKLELELQESHRTILRTNEQLQEFAYAASHDLQEPLRTMRLYSQLLDRNVRQKLSQDEVNLLDNILGATLRMRKLIEDFLAYSRTESISITAAAVNTETVLDQVIENLQGTIEESKALITRGSLPAVKANEAQVAQLLQNLLSNGIKFRKPEEPPRLSISGEAKEKHVQFRVEDNGIGFDQQYAEQIFGAFKRLEGRDVPGSGIGLAICRRTVERYGGRIWAQSVPGRGTVFFFTLPKPDGVSAN